MYRYDEHFEQNEQLWNKLKATILGEDEDEEEDEDEDEDEEEEEEEVQCMKRSSGDEKNRFGGCRC